MTNSGGFENNNKWILIFISMFRFPIYLDANYTVVISRYLRPSVQAWFHIVIEKLFNISERPLFVTDRDWKVNFTLVVSHIIMGM